MKKVLLIIVGIFLLGLGILLGYFIFNKPSTKCEIEDSKPSLKVKNVKEETIKGKTYYVMTDEYDGDFDYQETKIAEDFNVEGVNDLVKLFNTTEVLYYDDYVNFCKRWNLEQKYTDEEKKYAVVSYAEAGAGYAAAKLANFTIEDDTITIYIWDTVRSVLGDVPGYFLVIPVSNKVYYEKTVSLLNKEEASNLKKYGSTQDPKEIVEDKPIIYIYPEKEMEVNVRLGNPNILTTSYPKYNNGWTVTAKPDGTLTQNNKNYYGLYWEGKNHNIKVEKDGFVVEGKDTAKFLEEKLATLGLNEKEANEFIIYWLPKMEHNKYNYIRFETKEEINSYMPLEITPKPDSMIRIVMDFKALDNKINIKEQKLTTPLRTGYTVVEWGGSEIK